MKSQRYYCLGGAAAAGGRGAAGRARPAGLAEHGDREPTQTARLGKERGCAAGPAAEPSHWKTERKSPWCSGSESPRRGRLLLYRQGPSWCYRPGPGPCPCRSPSMAGRSVPSRGVARTGSRIAAAAPESQFHCPEGHVVFWHASEIVLSSRTVGQALAEAALGVAGDPTTADLS